MNRLLLAGFFIIFMGSCGNDYEDVRDISFALQTNKEWPFVVKGKIEIADAHQAEDDILDWASAIFVPSEYNGQVGVFITRDVIVESGLDIESEGIFVLSLGRPRIESGNYTTYPVTRVR